MYPFARLFWQFRKHRKDRPLGLFEEHVSRHICWPWDLDPWRELNNGRTLTLYDLGRLPLGRRIGLLEAMRSRGWGLTVAGSTIRYRHRVRAFDRVTMRSRTVGWDHRFLYVEQSMWLSDGTCASHALIRSAIVGTSGIVSPAEALEDLGGKEAQDTLPPWVQAWTEAEALRPWPPMSGPDTP
ncbi:acyl-CoA thioesterase [Roseisalinus antarcticus]|uniref:Thioesterase superfamily protein n=1 Tax=Roseisalinus antarcticus TaxID=254357 RepID=A0A1Y5TX62_9RHOB|nr:acyl-CoA thioesterase [Roseisalinus antarcticus]SLN75923.1 hypothetical protein ROA7023_04058 [Roseisalinus antarcticus]